MDNTLHWENNVAQWGMLDPLPPPVCQRCPNTSCISFHPIEAHCIWADLL